LCSLSHIPPYTPHFIFLTLYSSLHISHTVLSTCLHYWASPFASFNLHNHFHISSSLSASTRSTIIHSIHHPLILNPLYYSPVPPTPFFMYFIIPHYTLHSFHIFPLYSPPSAHLHHPSPFSISSTAPLPPNFTVVRLLYIPTIMYLTPHCHILQFRTLYPPYHISYILPLYTSHPPLCIHHHMSTITCTSSCIKHHLFPFTCSPFNTHPHISTIMHMPSHIYHYTLTFMSSLSDLYHFVFQCCISTVPYPLLYLLHICYYAPTVTSLPNLYHCTIKLCTPLHLLLHILCYMFPTLNHPFCTLHFLFIVAYSPRTCPALCTPLPHSLCLPLYSPFHVPHFIFSPPYFPLCFLHCVFTVTISIFTLSNFRDHFHISSLPPVSFAPCYHSHALQRMLYCHTSTLYLHNSNSQLPNHLTATAHLHSSTYHIIIIVCSLSHLPTNLPPHNQSISPPHKFYSH